MAVFFGDVIEHLHTSFGKEIHIDIGHGYTLGIKESFENKIVFYGIYGGDPKAV